MTVTNPIDDPDLLLSDLLMRWPQTAQVFMRHKMLCVGCLITPFHTVADACLEHNVPEEEFRRQLRRALADYNVSTST